MVEAVELMEVRVVQVVHQAVKREMVVEQVVLVDNPLIIMEVEAVVVLEDTVEMVVMVVSGNGGVGSGGSGGGGGGGGGQSSGGTQNNGGGGVGQNGEGSSGSGGSVNNPGTGGSSGGTGGSGGIGGNYGGGGGGAEDDTNRSGATGGSGIVRIIWGTVDNQRSFPSTNVLVNSTVTDETIIPTSGSIQISLFSGKPFLDMTPVFTITSNDVTSGSSSILTSLSFTLTSNFNTTNFISSDISPSNGSISNFSGSGKTYTVTFTPSGDGACKIAVPANTFTNSDTANIVLNNKESFI